MRRTPRLPASKDCYTASVVLPTEQIRPMPVMTTRRSTLAAELPAKLFARFRVLADVVDGVVDGADLFRVFVGDLDVEGLFEGHDELDGIERVGAEVIDEGSAGGDFALVDTKLLHNNLFHFFINSGHVLLVSESGNREPGLRAGVLIYDCMLLIASDEVGTSSLKGSCEERRGGITLESSLGVGSGVKRVDSDLRLTCLGDQERSHFRGFRPLHEFSRQRMPFVVLILSPLGGSAACSKMQIPHFVRDDNLLTADPSLRSG